MGKREAPSPRRQRRRRRRSWPRTLLLVVVVAAALYAGVHCLFQAPKLAEADAAEEETLSDTKLEDAQSAALAAHKERKPYFYTILLSGEDDGNGGSDTNILIGFDGQNGAIYGASIPPGHQGHHQRQKAQDQLRLQLRRLRAAGRHRFRAAGHPGGFHRLRGSQGI